MSRARILIIEDDPEGRESVREAVSALGVDVVDVGTGTDGVDAFREEPFDVVLSDLVLPDIDGLEVMRRVVEMDSEVPFLIMTAYGTVSTAVQALKAGAYDYITKPLDLDDLQNKVTRAAETSSLRSRVEGLQRSMQQKYGCNAITAEAPMMKELLEQVRTLAVTDATVLVLGESGAGKELIARALHAEGKRSAGPFVGVNCGAFTENLLESELFGHEKGAFTGASAQRKGAFERADGGTLFLDEISNAPPGVQVRLLRVLEEREFMRVGGQKPISVDVRLVSASNRDLDELVEEGEFRDDLLYRLKVVALEVPPLRVRPADIRPLAERFLREACREHGRDVTGIDEDAYRKLETYEWPGNVRELKNVIEASVVMAPGSVLAEKDVRIDDTRIEREMSTFDVPDGMSMADIEKEVLLQLLGRHRGNKTIVADVLGISRRTIQRKIKEYNLPF